MIKLKRKTILRRLSHSYQGNITHGRTRMGSKSGLESTSPERNPKWNKKKKSQKCLRQEFKEVLYCFNCALEHPPEFSTTERTYRVW